MTRRLWILMLLLLVSCQNATVQPTATPVPPPTLLPEPRTGRPVKANGPAAYRVMEDNHLRHIYDLPTYNALAYQGHDFVTIPQSDLITYIVDPPLTRWLTGQTDTGLYYLQRGVRYRITDHDMLRTTGGTPQDVVQVDDAFLHSFPLAAIPLEAADIPLRSDIRQVAASISSLIDSLRDSADTTWYADTSYYDTGTMQYHVGRGLVRRIADDEEKVITLNNDRSEALLHITVIAHDEARQKLWIGTRYAGLLSYDLTAQTWQHYTTFNSQISDDQINGISIAPDGTLWLAMRAGVSHFDGEKWQLYSIPDDITISGALSVVAVEDGAWVSGDNYIARIDIKGQWQLYSGFDHPLLLDRFSTVRLDDHSNPVFIGEQRLIRFSNRQWVAYEIESGESTPFEPDKPALTDITAFPDPTKDYVEWLKTWPRPDHDNGRGIHYLAFPSGDRFELHQQLQRMERLSIRWLLVNYTSRSQLLQMAPVFKAAGIMVIWRPFVRPYVEYPYWNQDVTFLRALGVPPYMQIYNEPSLGQEWEDKGKPIDQQVYLDHALPAMRAVFDAGGYVGLQHIDLNWLRTTLRLMKDKSMLNILPRLFFIPHAYGYNHPPDFDDDENSVLGFRQFAAVFEEEIGFVPMMIAGEGGWRPDEMQDQRYPMVTQTRYRDYMLAVLTWFHTGKLSNGEVLPDYFFAFCPWILSDPNDRAAWFDSIQGSRELVIQGVENLPEFERRFSWDEEPKTASPDK